jgi:hypothetical protein
MIENEIPRVTRIVVTHGVDPRQQRMSTAYQRREQHSHAKEQTCIIF